MTPAAVIAASRFGLGARPGELDAAAAGPRTWLEAQLRTTDRPPALRDLPAGGVAVQGMMRASRGTEGQNPRREAREAARRLYFREATALAEARVATATPLRERLVMFWANHFTVSVQRPTVRGLAGAFEREAIRPHVTGHFVDLLRASTRHPAMLVYLDNDRSIGPRSPAGRRRGKGLNENLARELMELHTLGVDGGYTQADVTELARILTGWSIGEDGGFAFRRAAHEPGAKALLGARYAEAGEDEGERALVALARHPATARHVAQRLARHFVADQPPPTLVDRLARTFADTDGDLDAVMLALIRAPEAWEEPLPKVRSPQELVLAAGRALEAAPATGELMSALRLMGQMPWAAPSPKGWPDTATDWAAPDALLQRAEWAADLARRRGREGNPRALLEASLGPAAGNATREAVRRAPSAAEAMALLFASPEFQRR